MAALLAVLACGGVARAEESSGLEVAAVPIYRTACAPCHGDDGRGAGPVAFAIAPYRAPRPRDFTTGVYKLRSTPSGTLPTDADLARTIRRGIPRYMPAFADFDDREIAALVAYVRSFTTRFDGPRPTALALPDLVPDLGPEAAARGAAHYTAFGCAVCHGPRGRGDGAAATALKDAAGLPIYPADLAHPSWFKGGGEPRDVYRTLVTGLDGTPMPGYRDVFTDLDAGTPWDLVAFVASLSRE
jgi:mono/diheme cytochrome c family protein